MVEIKDLKEVDMKRVLLPVLIIGVLLLVGCGAPAGLSEQEKEAYVPADFVELNGHPELAGKLVFVEGPVYFLHEEGSCRVFVLPQAEEGGWGQYTVVYFDWIDAPDLVDGDCVLVWGVYVGNDAFGGAPQITARLIEKHGRCPLPLALKGGDKNG